ncbi:Ddr48p [Penaeus vannamei]|uniref:Ddr48p n=1 Tax=Penaeus vannamei TaxID=6689 RepID=A0A3R7Q6A4_PENVA|nr:Ddr48p [Penaeus vannamei]
MSSSPTRTLPFGGSIRTRLFGSSFQGNGANRTRLSEPIRHVFREPNQDRVFSGSTQDTSFGQIRDAVFPEQSGRVFREVNRDAVFRESSGRVFGVNQEPSFGSQIRTRLFGDHRDARLRDQQTRPSGQPISNPSSESIKDTSRINQNASFGSQFKDALRSQSVTRPFRESIRNAPFGSHQDNRLSTRLFGKVHSRTRSFRINQDSSFRSQQDSSSESIRTRPSESHQELLSGVNQEPSSESIRTRLVGTNQVPSSGVKSGRVFGKPIMFDAVLSGSQQEPSFESIKDASLSQSVRVTSGPIRPSFEQSSDAFASQQDASFGINQDLLSGVNQDTSFGVNQGDASFGSQSGRVFGSQSGRVLSESIKGNASSGVNHDTSFGSQSQGTRLSGPIMTFYGVQSGRVFWEANQ